MKQFGSMLLLWLSVTVQTSYAQDVPFVQDFLMPISLNPAFSGSADAPRAAFGYRNQWPGTASNFVSYRLNYDMAIPTGGLGLRVVHISEVIQTDFEAQANYAFRQAITPKIDFVPSVEMGYLRTSSEFFNGLRVVRSNEENLNMGLAALVQHAKWNVGIVSRHLLSTDQSPFTSEENTLPTKWTFHGSYLFRLKQLKIQLNAWRQWQRHFSRYGIGLRYQLNNRFYWGTVVVVNEAFAGSVGVRLFNGFSVHYAYQMRFSELTLSDAQGTHEVLLTYQGFAKRLSRSMHTLEADAR